MGTPQQNAQAAHLGAAGIFAGTGLISFIAPAAVESYVFQNPTLSAESAFEVQLFGTGAMMLGAFLLTVPFDRATYLYMVLALVPITFMVWLCFANEMLLNDNAGLLSMLALFGVMFLYTFCSISKGLRLRRASPQNTLTRYFRVACMNVFFLRGFWFLKSPVQGAELFVKDPTVNDLSDFVLRAFGAMELLIVIGLAFGRFDSTARLSISIVFLFRGWWGSHMAQDALITTQFKVTQWPTRVIVSLEDHLIVFRQPLPYDVILILCDIPS